MQRWRTKERDRPPIVPLNSPPPARRTTMSTLDYEPDDTPRPTRPLWEAELEEILAASDRESTPVEKARSRVTSARYRAPVKATSVASRFRTRWTSGMWLLLFLGLVVLTFAVRHFSPFLGRMLALAALVMLIVIIGKALFRPSSSSTSESQMWRGRDMSLPARGDESRLSRWFGRRDQS